MAFWTYLLAYPIFSEYSPFEKNRKSVVAAINRMPGAKYGCGRIGEIGPYGGFTRAKAALIGHIKTYVSRMKSQVAMMMTAQSCSRKTGC